jgi:hypothetical protein
MTRDSYLTHAAVERLAEQLSDRDRRILDDVTRCRVLTGRQLERLHFMDLAPAHRDRARRRVLARLTSLSLLTPLQRRIGGARAGSAGLVFALGPAGQRVHTLLAVDEAAVPSRTRPPHTPGDRFLRHELAVAELYVELVEQTRAGGFVLVDFRAEPASWWQDSAGGWVRPDASVVVAWDAVEDAWAIEVDQATETLPTLRRKLVRYLELAELAESGPDGRGLPRVLVVVPDQRRHIAVQRVIADLPAPAADLLVVVENNQAVRHLFTVLRE